MRKMPTVVLLVMMFLLLGVLFLLMCLPIGQVPANAAGGVLDLRDTPMDKTVFALGGEWLFCPDALHVPADSCDHAQTAVLPGAWENEPTGCGTYRLTVRTSETGRLMLFLPEIASAYALWINGEFVREAGVVSDQAETGSPLFDNALLSVQAADEIEILIQVSNYHFLQGGITIPLLFGREAAVLAWFVRTRALYCMALGAILMIAFYHAALFFFRRREMMYLYFCVMCCICLLRFMTETNGINQFLQWIPLDRLGLRIYLALFFLHSALIVLLSLYCFDRAYLVRHKHAAIGMTAAGVLVFSLMPLTHPFAMLAITMTLLPPALFVVIRAARSQVLRENDWSRLYFVALILYTVLGFVTKIFFDHVLFMPGLLTNMFLIMAQSLVLSHYYAEAFALAERTNENLERHVAMRTQDLRHANQTMKELVGNISHDLKTPLTEMSVNLEKLLEATSGSGRETRYVQIAYQKNRDLQRLIQNLIEVSRIEAGHSLYRPEWIRLHDVLARVQTKYGDYLESEQLFFDVSSTGEDVWLYTDPVKIWNVFDNVIYNAVRHTQTGGITIAAHTAPEDSFVTIAVTDTGCGIAPECLPPIFDRFYKASNNRGKQEGDSGVGLYIVKSVMEGCEGRVSIQSEVGVGTTLFLSFLKNSEK